MTDSLFDHLPISTAFGFGGLCIGIMIGAVLGSHKAPRHTRKMVEHCVLISTGSDYHDVECPSGTWRYYGDTLRVRLHT